FDSQDRFFDLLYRLRARFLDLFRQPESFDHVEDDNAGEDDEKQRLGKVLEVANDRRDRAAEEVSGTTEKQDPKEPAYCVKPKEREERHSGDAVEQAHRDAYAI